MNNSFFRINDFTSKNRFDKLKNNFISQDIDFDNPNVKNNFDKINPKIDTYEIIKVDEEISDTIIIKQEFIKDFLLSGIRNIVENETADFERYCNDKGIVTKQGKKGYLQILNKKIEKNLSVIEKANYLDYNLKKYLQKSIKYLLKELSKKLQLTYREVPKRIKFNWKKNQIQALFYLLWKNNIIEAEKPSEIGNILDFCFEYQDESGNYIEMKNSRKELSDIKRLKGDITPINKLKEILSNKDFYTNNN